MLFTGVPAAGAARGTGERTAPPDPQSGHEWRRRYFRQRARAEAFKAQLNEQATRLGARRSALGARAATARTKSTK